MEQDTTLDRLVRQRIRGLRVARGWSLDDLARRCHVSPSNLSRIETGHRRIALDQLAVIARALGTTLDQLVESADDDDVVIRPRRDVVRGASTWLLTSPDRAPHGVSVAKLRITEPTSPRAQVGERVILVEAGEAAEFSCMIPHAIGAHGGPVEILAILDHDGDRAHIQAHKAARPAD